MCSKTYEAEGKHAQTTKPPLVLDCVQVKIHCGRICGAAWAFGFGQIYALTYPGWFDSPLVGSGASSKDSPTGTNPHIAIVFQSFALFPWLTVLQNVELGLEAQPIDARHSVSNAH